MAALRKAKRGEINYPMFDQWAFMHGASGFVAGAMGASFMGALAITIGFEIVEKDLKRAFPKAFPVPTADTTANHIGDSISFMAGWTVGKKAQ